MRIFQVKLYLKNDYFYGGIKPNVLQFDEDMIIEILSQNIKVNKANRGGNVYEGNI